MEIRQLGSTGLTVSRIGLGLAALGRPGYINLGHAADLGHRYDVAAMETHAHGVLDAAWDAGIRYFDAARSYGNAEHFLASWLRLRNRKPGEVGVGSKWGYTYTANWQVAAEHHEIKDHTQTVLLRQSAESRGLLGPFLGLYQIHSATLESGVQEDRAVLAELSNLKKSGWAIGLSVSGPRQAETISRALTIFQGKGRLFDCVQATWNVLERSCETALREAHDAGLGVIVKEALANGRLTTRNDDPKFAEKRRRLEAVATGFGCSLDQLCLAFVLQQPWADVVLSGAASKEHLHSNLGALAVILNAESLAALENLRESSDVYWGERRQLRWN